MCRRLIVLAFVIVLAAGAAACGAGSTSATVTASQSATATQQWVEIIALRGGEEMRNTRPFTLQGGEQKLVGSVSSSESLCGAAWSVQSADGGLGYEMVSAEAPGRIDSRLYLPAGRYFVGVNTFNCRWNVTLYELR